MDRLLPVRSQGADDVYDRFLQFIGPCQEVKYVHTDDSAALKAALAELKYAMTHLFQVSLKQMALPKGKLRKWFMA